MSCEELAIYFPNLAYMAHIRQNHSILSKYTFQKIKQLDQSAKKEHAIKWEISANVNNILGFFATHCFTNYGRNAITKRLLSVGIGVF
jgi:hypothetical protein